MFPEVFAKPLTMRFDQRQGSPDGGAVLLKAAERRYDLLDRLAGCLVDERQAGKVDHPLTELVAQRIFSIACRYADANDAARLKADPHQKPDLAEGVSWLERTLPFSSKSPQNRH